MCFAITYQQICQKLYEKNNLKKNCSHTIFRNFRNEDCNTEDNPRQTYMKKRLLLLALLTCGGLTTASAQNWAVKTNLAYWATTTINLGTEIALGQRTTLDIVGAYNPFRFHNNKKLLFWGVQPELRLWTCRKFEGHFFGIHAHYGQYNGGLEKYRYDGWLAGGGLSYGYQWVLSNRWNLETEIGVGYARLDYDKYDRPLCGEFKKHDVKNYFGPTRLSISFVYILK